MKDVYLPLVALVFVKKKVDQPRKDNQQLINNFMSPLSQIQVFPSPSVSRIL